MKKGTLQEFEDYLIRNNYTVQTTKGYVFDMGHYLINMPHAEKVNRMGFLSYIEQLQAARQSKGNINRQLHAIKKYYDFLIDTGRIRKHPCKSFHLKGARKNEIQHQNLLEPADLELLLQKVYEREERFPKQKNRNRIIMTLLIQQGLTLGELTLIKTGDVDIDNALIRVRGNGKVASRTLQLNSKQIKLFMEYMDEKDSSERTQHSFFLQNMRNKSETVSGLGYLIETYRPLFPGKKLSAQLIRMSVISKWLNQDQGTLDELRMLSGIKWLSSVVKYRRPDDMKQKELINRFFPIK
jgi:integrase/recombinase XerD